MNSTKQEREYYTAALWEEIKGDRHLYFNPFEGAGVDRVMDELVRRGYEINVYARKIKGWKGGFAGPSYEVVVFDGEETKAKLEAADFYEAVTLAAVRALGLMKLKTRVVHLISDEDEDGEVW